MKFRQLHGKFTNKTRLAFCYPSYNVVIIIFVLFRFPTEALGMSFVRVELREELGLSNVH